MCDENSSRFFRPWSVEKTSRPNSPEGEDYEAVNRRSPIKLDEDDDNSFTSTSTYGEYSAESSSEQETSSLRVSVKRNRRRSKSFTEAGSSSCSLNSDDVVPENSLDRLNNFVLNSPSVLSFPVTGIPSETSDFSPEATSLVTNGCPSSTSVYPVDYLQIAFHQANSFGTLNDNPGFTNMGPCVPEASTIATTGQSFCYDYPRLPNFPQRLYGPSMQQAVELIHRQDVAAKQMKKLRPKKFRCEHCDVAFSNNGQLKGHVRIHTGERPFKCDAEGCGKSFTRNEELTRHKRIHTGLRPHVCVICGKCFGRKDHLKKHMRTHENRDPFRMSATAFSMYGMGHAIPPPHVFPSYIYPI